MRKLSMARIHFIQLRLGFDGFRC